MAKEITLIFPRFIYRNFALPIGFLSIAAVLEKEGYKVNFLDGTILSQEEILTTLEKSHPKYLFISLQSVFANKTFKLIQDYKKMNPEAVVIVGGPHPTLLPIETVQTEGVDVAVTQEAEETVPDLMNHLENNLPLNEVKGIAFRQNGKAVLNAPRPLVQSLENLPIPARHLLADGYFATGISSFMGSRGCPWTCSFCQPTLDKLFGEKFRLRPVEKVIEEIQSTKQLFKDRGFELKEVHFTDDGLTYNHPWLKNFCQQLIDKKIGIKWTANSRCDTMPNLELAKLMHQAGCLMLSFGVESANDHIRNVILDKKLPREKILHAFKTCHEAGIETEAYLMVGSLGENPSTILETVQLLDEIEPTITQVSITAPLPNTYFYDQWNDKGVIETTSFEELGAYGSESHLKLKDLTHEQVKDFQKAIFYSIFVREKFAKLGIPVKYSALFTVIRTKPLNRSLQFLQNLRFKLRNTVNA